MKVKLYKLRDKNIYAIQIFGIRHMLAMEIDFTFSTFLALPHYYKNKESKSNNTIIIHRFVWLLFAISFAKKLIKKGG